MKNLLKITVAVIAITAFSFNSNAQSGVGGGLSYLLPGWGGDNAIGVNARGAIGLNESMEIAPGINYYLYSDATVIGINGDFHYLLGSEGEMRFYPLAGINYFSMKVDLGPFGSASNSEIQFNVGGGIKLPMGDSMHLYTEGKYMIGDADGIAISAGILFNIGG